MFGKVLERRVECARKSERDAWRLEGGRERENDKIVY